MYPPVASRPTNFTNLALIGFSNSTRFKTEFLAQLATLAEVKFTPSSLVRISPTVTVPLAPDTSCLGIYSNALSLMTLSSSSTISRLLSLPFQAECQKVSGFPSSAYSLRLFRSACSDETDLILILLVETYRFATFSSFGLKPSVTSSLKREVPLFRFRTIMVLSPSNLVSLVNSFQVLLSAAFHSSFSMSPTTLFSKSFTATLGVVWRLISITIACFLMCSGLFASRFPPSPNFPPSPIKCTTISCSSVNSASSSSLSLWILSLVSFHVCLPSKLYS